MKRKSWNQIDAQYKRLNRELDKAIIRGDIAIVSSKRWDIITNAWRTMRNRISTLQNGKFEYVIPNKNIKYPRLIYAGY